MSSTTTLPPVRKAVTVRRSIEDAFRLFTSGIATWWPLATHSVFGESAERVVIETRKGGAIFEERADGKRAIWGHILGWDPPHRLVFTWHPGSTPQSAQEVEVRFLERGEETLLELEHRGFEILGERASETRDSYDQGWTPVLADFVRVASPMALD